MRTTHTRLFTPDDYDYYVLLDIVGAGVDRDFLSRRFWGSGPYYPGTGAFTQQLDGHHFVDGVLEGSPSERAGLKYGDEILSVDGFPYGPVAAFRGKIGATADLVIRRAAEGPLEHLMVSVVPVRPSTAFSAATEASSRTIERDTHRVGYVHVWASGERADHARRAASQCPHRQKRVGGHQPGVGSPQYQARRLSHRGHARSGRGLYARCSAVA